MAKNNFNQWSLAFLRAVFGFVFAYHGYLKLFAPGGFAGTVSFFAMIKIPLPLYSALIVSVVEFAGGIFLIFGMVTKLSSLLLLIDMLVAFFMVHMKNGFLISKGGFEFVIILIAGLVIILVNGAGKISVGKLFKNKYLK